MTALVVLREVFVHDDATPVHRCCRITAEGVECEVVSLALSGLLIEEDVLGGQYSLRGHIVGIHLLPATRHGAPVEDDLQPIAVGIAENILVEAHGLLLVTTEEIDLDAFDTYRLHPLHLAFTGNRSVHTVTRPLGRIVGKTIGVVPKHQMDALRLGIL